MSTFDATTIVIFSTPGLTDPSVYVNYKTIQFLGGQVAYDIEITHSPCDVDKASPRGLV